MTLTEKAYIALRHDIVCSELKPGQPLRMADLSKRYGMGFSPLREALNRLQVEGLATLAPLKGFAVSNLSLTEMHDVVRLRILVESEALALSIKLGGDEWEAGIVSTLHALTRQAERKNVTTGDALWELEKRHHVFHRQLISACGSPRMLNFFEMLYVDTERYRIPLLLKSGTASVRDIQDEHTEIANAAISRKVSRAVDLLVEHYRRTAKAINAQDDVVAKAPAKKKMARLRAAQSESSPNQRTVAVRRQ